MTGVLKVDDIQDAGANSIVSSNGSGTLTFGSFSAPNITASTAILPDASDGAAIGSASLEWSDIFLADGAIINLGDDQDVTLTHVADTGILLNSSRKIQFGDSATFIHQSADGVMTIDGEATIDLNASTAVLVSNDLKLNSDSAVIGFGADNDTTLTHTDGTGLTLNSTNKLTFGDAASFIQQSSDGVLRIDGEATVDINASSAVTIGADEIPVTISGITFYSNGTSMYSHNVSGTDNSADYNTAFGFNALDAVTTGDKVVAIGYQAATAAQTTSDSVIIGVQAGQSLTGGHTNIIIGVNALDTATTCDENIAIGAHALGGSLDASTKNVCIGRYSGESITTGDNNTFVGYDAGSDQTTATGNTFIGYKTGHGVATGGSNNAVGNDALSGLTSGYYNNAFGSSALYAVSSGINNIAVGHDAGYDTATGDHNTYIGYKAKASGVNVDNEIIIGHGHHITTFTAGGTGTIRMGMHNNYITNTFTSNANWAHSSDERWKKNINDNSIGLDFINDLRTVSYNWRAFSEIDPSLSEYNAEDTEYPHPGTQHGLIAQEVKSAMDKHGIEEFAGWYEDKTHEDKQQGISESMYVIPLIKAVQELSAKVKDLELKLEDK